MNETIYDTLHGTLLQGLHSELALTPSVKILTLNYRAERQQGAEEEQQGAEWKQAPNIYMKTTGKINNSRDVQLAGQQSTLGSQHRETGLKV